MFPYLKLNFPFIYIEWPFLKCHSDFSLSREGKNKKQTEAVLPPSGAKVALQGEDSTGKMNESRLQMDVGGSGECAERNGVKRKRNASILFEADCAPKRGRLHNLKKKVLFLALQPSELPVQACHLSINRRCYNIHSITSQCKADTNIRRAS